MVRQRRPLEAAARLQEVVPDAVLVGGSAAALWASWDNVTAVCRAVATEMTR